MPSLNAVQPRQPKCYLSPSDRERIKRELSDIEARRKSSTNAVDASVGHGYYRPPEIALNDELLKKREIELKNTLAKESPPELSGHQKSAAYKEFKSLVREFEELAITKQQQGYGYPKIMEKRADAEIDFEIAKRKCQAHEFSPRGQYVANRLKELAGVIDPDNPQLRNLENFRRAR